MRCVQNSVVVGAMLTSVAVAGCAQEAEQGPDTCGSADAQAAMGTVINPEDFKGNANVRVIPEGSVITMDFRADRLNYDLDAEGKVKRIWCG